ncbi:MAG: hypothetical protein M1825_003278 [Sarcosagium campestre]|nr:MAG: hypothetical protein M1825_003278 [Sarcosagium campestre]
MSSTWLWREVFVDAQYTETMMPVNYVMLAVIAGIFSVVLAGFTGWHLSLAWRNQTTIECLEKTRYLSPLRRSMQLHHYRHQHSAEGGSGPSYGQQLREIHTNAIPGVTRPEEGEERRSPDVGGGDGAPPRFGEDSHFHRSYEDMQRSRERERYESYLDERDSDSLPNAFDLGWRRNLLHLFGENPKLWLFPICNTTGDGWNWEANPRWTDAREALRRTRESQTQWHDQRNDREDGEANNSWPGGDEHHAGRHYVDSAWSSTQHHPANGAGQLASSMGHRNQNEHFSRISAGGNGSEHWNNQDDGYETSSDDEHAARMLQHNEQNGRGEGQK